MDSLENRVHELQMQYGILDFKEQTKEVSRAYLKSLSSPGSKSAIEAKRIYDNLINKGAELNAINEHLWRTRGFYNDLKVVYENAERDVFKKLTYANVVTPPSPSDKKASPIRWLIVLVSVSSALLMSFIVIILFFAKAESSK
jgi:hypothetical protein